MDNMAQRKQERPSPAPAASAVGVVVRQVRPPDTSAALRLDQVVEFPSRDGFEIRLV